MEGFNVILFRGSRRLGFRGEDLTTEKIGMIFQVRSQTVFLTNDHNQVLLPDQGVFETAEMQYGGHYEVSGEGNDEGTTWSTQNQSPNLNRFAFRRPTSTPFAAGTAMSAARQTGPKMMQRNVLIAEVVNGRPETRKTVTVKFSEFEASVASITSKVSEALAQEEPVVLIDSHGNEIVDCEGTRGSAFWKQQARKIFAIPEEQLERLRGSKRKRESRHEGTELREVLDQIEEVVLASQGLQEVSRIMKDLVHLVQANQHTPTSLNANQKAAVQGAFTCVICSDHMKEPILGSCCKSLLGCRTCIEQWQQDHNYCPKCRTAVFDIHKQPVVGLDDALTALASLIN